MLLRNAKSRLDWLVVLEDRHAFQQNIEATFVSLREITLREMKGDPVISFREGYGIAGQERARFPVVALCLIRGGLLPFGALAIKLPECHGEAAGIKPVLAPGIPFRLAALRASAIDAQGFVLRQLLQEPTDVRGTTLQPVSQSILHERKGRKGFGCTELQVHERKAEPAIPELVELLKTRFESPAENLFCPIGVSGFPQAFREPQERLRAAPVQGQNRLVLFFGLVVAPAPLEDPSFEVRQFGLGLGARARRTEAFERFAIPSRVVDWQKLEHRVEAKIAVFFGNVDSLEAEHVLAGTKVALIEPHFRS